MPSCWPTGPGQALSPGWLPAPTAGMGDPEHSHCLEAQLPWAVILFWKLGAGPIDLWTTKPLDCHTKICEQPGTQGVDCCWPNAKWAPLGALDKDQLCQTRGSKRGSGGQMRRNLWTRRGSRGWEEGRRSHRGPAGAFVLWGYPALKRRTSGQHKDHGMRITASAKRVSQGTSSRIVLRDTFPSPRMCPNRAAKICQAGQCPPCA